jgi:hypothetical protein
MVGQQICDPEKKKSIPKKGQLITEAGEKIDSA